MPYFPESQLLCLQRQVSEASLWRQPGEWCPMPSAPLGRAGEWGGPDGPGRATVGGMGR